MKAIVCWNKCDINEKQQLEKFISFLLMMDENELLVDFLFSEDEFRTMTVPINSYYAIIVLCELTWENKPYESFYGIDFIQNEIRLKGINLPVLFLSFINRNQILRIDSAKQIISTYSLGNHFIQIPLASQSDIDKFFRMELVPPSEMEDSLNFISYQKIVSTIRHDLHNDNVEECKGRLINIIKKANLSEQNDYIQKLESIDEVNELKLFCDTIEKDIPEQGNTVKKSRDNHKVLLLEDTVTEEIHLLLNEANESNVNMIHCKKTSEAYELISNDNLNQFTVIIADFRIWDNPDAEHEEKLMSEKQGYRFIEDVVKLGRRYTFVAFSELPRAFRMRISSYSNTLIIPEEKSIALSSEVQRKTFINKIAYWSDQTQLSFANRASTNPLFVLCYNYLKTHKRQSYVDIDRESSKLIEEFNKTFQDVKHIFDQNNDYKNKIKGLSFKQEWNMPSDEDEVLVRWIYDKVYKNWKPKTDKKDIILKNLDKDTSKTIIESICKKLKEWYVHYGDRTQAHKLKNTKLSQFSSEERKVILKSRAAKPDKREIDLEKDINTFINKLIIRRLSIYFYYWLIINQKNLNTIIFPNNLMKNPFGFINCVNSFLHNWYINKNYCHTETRKEAPKTTQKALWISNTRDRSITKLSEIGLTYEEELFFNENFPDLYTRWKSGS